MVILKRGKQCSWAKATQIFLYLCETASICLDLLSTSNSGTLGLHQGKLLVQRFSLMAPGHCQTLKPPAPGPAAALELLFALVLGANLTATSKSHRALGGSPGKLFLSSLDGMFLSAPSRGDEKGKQKWYNRLDSSFMGDSGDHHGPLGRANPALPSDTVP